MPRDRSDSQENSFPKHADGHSKHFLTIGLDVSREPTENKSAAWYTQRSEVLYLSIASTLEGRWRETHCKDEPADCYARIDRRLLQLTDDGTLPPLPDDADEATKALDATIRNICDLAPSKATLERYKEEQLGR